MKFKIKYVLILSFLWMPFKSIHAQYADRFNNSFKLQYGLFQYNNDANEWVNAENNYFLNVGMSYRMRLGKLSGLSLSGRHYESRLNSFTKQNTDAVQLMWEIHPNRIGRNWKVSKIMPYFGIGIGYENHSFNYDSIYANTTDNYFYIPLEIGIDYNLSSRFSIGVFAEYKLSGDFNVKDIVKRPTRNTDAINSAGISLTYFFGRNKKRIIMPEVYTGSISLNQSAPKVIHEYIAEDRKLKDSINLLNENIEYRKLIDSIVFLNKSLDTITIIKTEINTAPAKVQDEKLDVIDIQIVPMKIKDNKQIQDTSKTTLVEQTIVADTTILTSMTNEVIKPDTILIKNANNEKQILIAVENNQYQLDSLANEINVIKKMTDTTVINNPSNEKQILIAVEKNQYQLDSMANEINIIKEMLKNQKTTSFTTIRDTVFLQAQTINQNDNPDITQLKKNYNEIAQTIEKNNQLGYYNQDELKRIKIETELINKRLNALPTAKGNNISLSDATGLVAALALLQKKTKSAEQAPIINQFILPQANQDSLKVDSTAIEAEIISQTASIDSIIQTDSITAELSPDPQLQELINNQSVLQEKMLQLEQQNSALTELLNQQAAQQKQQIIAEKAIETKSEVVEKETITIPSMSIYFDINAYKLNAQSKKALADFVASVSKTEQIMIMLSGYADKSGNAAYNLQLSQKRINAVKSELLQLGIKKEHITSRNFGSSKANNANGNARKVDIKVLKLQ